MDLTEHDPIRFLQIEYNRLQSEVETLQKQVSSLRQVINALRDLQEVPSLITENTEPFTLVESILKAALICVSADNGSLALFDHESEELVFVVVHGEVSALVNFRQPISDGIGGWVVRHGEPVRLANARTDERFSPTVDERFGFITRSLLCVPLSYSERVYGVLYAINKADGSEFNSDDTSLLMVVAGLAARALAKAESSAP